MNSQLTGMATALQGLNPQDGLIATPLAGVELACRYAPRTARPCFYQATCILLVQGQKELLFGERQLEIEGGEYILSCTSVPVFSKVVRATPQEPTISLILNLEPALMAQLICDLELEGQFEEAQFLESFPLEIGGLEIWRRLVQLLQMEAPLQRVLWPGLKRELYCHLLLGPGSSALRGTYQAGAVPCQIARALSILQNSFKERLAMERLAQEVNLSPSAFYRHFKRLLQVTPLQYQKYLRLQEAQQLLWAGWEVQQAAYEVGYESPSQFSRDFKRRFGLSPSAVGPGKE